MALQNLRICMLGPHYPRPGGATTQVELLSEYLRADGVEVHPVDTNVQTVRRYGPIGKLLLPLAQSALVPLRLWRAARGADLVHVHLASYRGFDLPMRAAVLVGRLRSLPIVATYHGGKPPEFVARNRGRVRWLLGRAAALIALSRYTGRVFEEIGLAPRLIPNVVRLEQFEPRPGGTHME